ncbi:helix-turn-helix transcriptional regulator [Nitrosomonas communis]|nr:HTH domain-containing protein [Nitrosomonas communis]
MQYKHVKTVLNDKISIKMSALLLLGQRQQLLLTALLRHRKGLTVEELSRMLAISRNAVNQHLSSLGGDGFIQSTLLESTGGRPSRIYTLTPSGLELFERRYSFFAKLLLFWIDKKLDEQELKDCLTGLGEQMAREFEYRVTRHFSHADRLHEVIAIMCELGYDANVTKISDHHTEIVANNCVFHELAEQCQGFCTLDLSFLASLLKADIEHKECIVKNEGRCCFRVVFPLNRLLNKPTDCS